MFTSYLIHLVLTKSLNHYLAKKNQWAKKELKIKSLSGRGKSDTKEPTQSKQIDLNEITKPSWIKLSRSDSGSLIKDVVNNLDNKDYQTKINNDNYDLKNAEKFFLEIVAKKNSENEAPELYKNLIEPKTDKLKNAKGKVRDNRSNILTILENIKLVFLMVSIIITLISQK